jgi:hypothetical protein
MSAAPDIKQILEEMRAESFGFVGPDNGRPLVPLAALSFFLADRREHD